MGVEPLTLIANPGSASRKYALYKGHVLRAHLHFERENGHIVCSVQLGENSRRVTVQVDELDQSVKHIVRIFQEQDVLNAADGIGRIGLRIVAPGVFFLEDHFLDADFLHRLEKAEQHAPLHVRAAFEEAASLHEQFHGVPIIGVSDSAFHITKPDFAWNYGIPLHDADRFDIKRFGYHGISIGSVVHKLRTYEKLPPRVVVCHLGSGASVTALYHGKSFDTTMGYSPLEGLIMATRSGTLDPTAVRVLQYELNLEDAAMQEYLNRRSGLLGLSGLSSDIRELVEHENAGNHPAALALQTYVHAVQKGIGQMVAALGGVDLLIFTGTVGERSAIMRERIVAKLSYLDFLLDGRSNRQCEEPAHLTCISRLTHSKPIFVIPTDETSEMLRRMDALDLG